jgi:hypothetical protein
MRTFKKTVSKKQLAANRANAKKSRGPVTAEGKEKSAQNARWHGLCGRFKVLPCEDQAAFDDLFDSFVRDEKPVGSAELQLVRKMAEYTWLSQRATYLQDFCFRVELQTAAQAKTHQHDVQINFPRLDLVMRYQAHCDRSYSRAANELIRRRKERLLQESRVVQQKRQQAADKRREKHHELREEYQLVRTATAKTDLESKQINLQAKKSALQAAAGSRGEPLAA